MQRDAQQRAIDLAAGLDAGAGPSGPGWRVATGEVALHIADSGFVSVWCQGASVPGALSVLERVSAWLLEEDA